MVAKFRNGGQACTAANAFYVHADLVDAFLERFGTEVEKLTVGPAHSGAAIGPLISAAAVERVGATVNRAIAEGARVSHQASMPYEPGWFYPPTVLADVCPGASILRDEVFGPVAPIVPWANEDDLLAQINDTEYGLAAYVFSGDTGRALRFAERIEAGMVGVNRGVVSDPSAPFGGVKQSGLGVDWPA
jgi:succinate-semialdehyde dehydrogenase/glutarate-semialdehyde dehydrogenase